MVPLIINFILSMTINYNYLIFDYISSWLLCVMHRSNYMIFLSIINLNFLYGQLI